MKFTLEIIEPASAKNKFEFDKSEVTFGRTGPNDVIINDRKVSRQHAKIEFKGNIPLLRDLGSQNGTIVNGNKIEEKELKSGDRIKIGDTQFQFTLHGSSLEGPLSLESLTGGEGIIKNFPQLIKNPIIAGSLGIICIIILCLSLFLKKESVDKAPVKDISNIPIPLPAQDIYGNCKQDRTHKDKVIFTFKGKTDHKAFLTYTIGGIEKKDEVVISLNGEVIGNSPVASGWKEVKDIKLPWKQIDSSMDNLLVFDNTLNPPEDESWGLTEVSIKWKKLLKCNLTRAKESFGLARRKYKDKSISYPNLYNSIKAYTDSLDYMENCSEKPDFYKEAMEGLSMASLELEKEYQKHLFNAQKAFKLKDYETAVNEYKIIMSMIPDTNDSRYQTAEEGLYQDIP
ncbi:MAG: FHA domain-containing protein [Thermodesulfobacteriota bacterium]|nr:FHA domain-containing protein [Thermodesulfobacteriota bacterium]